MLREFLIVLTQLTVLALAVATGPCLMAFPLVWIVGVVAVAWTIAISWFVVGLRVLLKATSTK